MKVTDINTELIDDHRSTKGRCLKFTLLWFRTLSKKKSYLLFVN